MISGRGRTSLFLVASALIVVEASVITLTVVEWMRATLPASTHVVLLIVGVAGLVMAIPAGLGTRGAKAPRSTAGTASPAPAPDQTQPGAQS